MTVTAQADAASLHIHLTTRPRQLQVIDSQAGWAAARASLAGLCEQAGAPPFTAPDWLEAAWLWRADAASLRVHTTGAGEQCRGFAPLALTPARFAGVPVRTLHFITVPDTQFVDLVARPEDAAGFAAELAGHLRARCGEWDRLQLNYLADRHANWRLLADALDRIGIDTVIEPAGINPVIDLAGGFDAYYDTRGRKLKKAVNLSANRLARSGEVDVQWVRDGAVDVALADAIRVSAISWKQSTGNSLDRPGPRAFIERLTAHAAGSGRLSLWLLRVGGRVVATEYQLIDRGDVYALRADFDPALADASPGTYLNHHLLKRLCGAGLRRYYMGPGANAYKLRWTDSGEPMFRLTAFSPTARGRLLRWLACTARPLARRLRRRLSRATTAVTEAPSS